MVIRSFEKAVKPEVFISKVSPTDWSDFIKEAILRNLLGRMVVIKSIINN